MSDESKPENEQEPTDESRRLTKEQLDALRRTEQPIYLHKFNFTYRDLPDDEPVNKPKPKPSIDLSTKAKHEPPPSNEE